MISFIFQGERCPVNPAPSKHPIYGSVMLIPVLLTTLFTIPHWWKKEETTKKRILTFPLLLTQFWPQFQVIKVLKLVIQGDSQWKVEKEKLEKEISSLGKYARGHVTGWLPWLVWFGGAGPGYSNGISHFSGIFLLAQGGWNPL